MIDDKTQQLILHRIHIALLGSGVHTAICYDLYSQGFFRTTQFEFLLLFGFFWVVNLSIYFVFRIGLNRQLRDPGLTFPLIVWALGTLLSTIYLTDHWRSVLLMITLLIMMFGAFRLFWYQFLYLIVSIIIVYAGIIIALYKFYPNLIDIPHEILTFLVFSFTLFCVSTLSWDFSKIRLNLKNRTYELEKALKIIELDSITDELTHVKNRRYVLDILNHQRLMVDRERTHTFAVCMLDLDNFKQINDAFGHGMGDIVLKAFCKEVELSLRKIDIFGRFGGEEFIVIAPFTDKAQVEILSERIRDSVEKMTIHHGGHLLKITVSVGASQYQWPESIEELLMRIDVALYESKNQGRNKVVVN